MIDLGNHEFKSLTEKIVKPEESFIISYVDKCLESEGTIISTCRIRRILYTKYKKSYLNQVMDKQCHHLIPNEQEKLLNILRKFESLFNGTLGTWKNAPLYLELTDEITLVCSRPYLFVVQGPYTYLRHR